jgi:hypothetical protein
VNAYRQLYKAATAKPARHSYSDMKYVSSGDSMCLPEHIDMLSRQFHVLDMETQRINWTEELVE